MESYWSPVYNVLENDCSIADLFKHDFVDGIFMPTADIRQLRNLMR